MKPFAVVCINPNTLARLVFETNPDDGRRAMHEAYNHTAGVFDSKDIEGRGHKTNPCSTYFADTDTTALALAKDLAQWHPGTSWQVMKITNIVNSRSCLPMSMISTKNINEKGLLP